MPSPEQKCVDWMMDLLVRFSSARHLVQRHGAGTLAVIKAFPLFPDHHFFSGCKNDEVNGSKNI